MDKQKTGTVVEELTEEEKEQLKKQLKIKSPTEEWQKCGPVMRW